MNTNQLAQPNVEAEVILDDVVRELSEAEIELIGGGTANMNGL